MKILTGVFTSWGKGYMTLFGSLGGSGQAGDFLDRNPGFRKKVALVAVIVIIAALVSLYIRSTPATEVYRGPLSALGEALADETIKAIGDHGLVVPVIPEYHTSDIPPRAYEWRGFAKAIKKHSGVTLAAPVIVKPEDWGEVTSRASFDKLVDKNANASALVLFVGLPPWEDNNPLTLPRVAPKIIALQRCILLTTVKQYFINSIVTVLITPRPPSENVPGDPNTPRPWFQVITAENYQSLPDH